MFNKLQSSVTAGGKNAQYKTMFDSFDKDSSGFIDKKDLVEITKGSLPESSITMIMNFVDKNGDGKIDLNEFKSIMKKVEQAKKFLPAPK
mmetsp:Transcript_35235/g.38141  ORF Transcript_35235/g.38141 Transcript_35235/m.38141 type:complete len:90 (+) Transcript_35235:155-424(+)